MQWYLLLLNEISRRRSRRSLDWGGRNRIGRREKWPKQSWEEGEIGGKSREEGEKEKQTFREEGEIGSESREREICPPVPPPSRLAEDGKVMFNDLYCTYTAKVLVI